MKLNMSSQKFDADKELLTLIQKKADKLDVFFDKIIDGDVQLKVEKDDAKENKILEMKVNVPGTSFFVKEKAASFEVAVDGAVEALRRQLKKHKGKLVS